MKCAHCGAALIDGLGTCYRCGLTAQPARVQAWADLDDAPFTLPRPAQRVPVAQPRAAPRPAAARVLPLSLRAAGWCALALAGMGLLDVLLGDDAIVVPFALLHALAGVALLRRWRGAWSGAVVMGVLDALLAFVALAGGVLVPSLVVAALAGGMLRALFRPATRDAVRRRRSGKRAAATAGPGATLIRPA